MTPLRRFDLAMRIITAPALVLLATLPIAALWDAITWPTAGRIALTTIIAWLALATTSALLWHRDT